MNNRYNNRFIPNPHWYNPKHPERPVPCRTEPENLFRLSRRTVMDICRERGITKKKYRKLQKLDRLQPVSIVE